jgi:o-succinylbenzoate synthase
MESVASAESTLRAVLGRLEGGALEPGRLPADLAAQLQAAPAARTAIEGALWDLAARRAGQPLAAYLASHIGRGADDALRRVPVSALLVAVEPDALREAAIHVRAAGYRAAKLKLGSATLAEDVARMRAAREGLGPEVRLRGDANGAWSVAEAFEALDAIAPCDVEYVEQPVAARDVAGLAELRRRAAVRIAADESAATEQGLLDVLAAGAADVVVLKPAALGGPARALELAVQARRTGASVVFTHMFESAVGARHVLHCAAAWGDPRGAHGLQTAGLFTADVAEPVDSQDGWARIADAPGLGITP